jgi:glycosyl hydrolase family 16
MRRWGGLMARAAALVPALLALAFCMCAAPAAAGTFEFHATADTYVDSGSPKKVFGTSKHVWTHGDIPVEQTFVRFKVAGLTGTVTHAVVRLYVTDGTNNGPAVFEVTDSWSERTTNWNNRPSRTSAPRDDKDGMSAGRWVAWDVTPWVTDDGGVSFALRGGAGNKVGLSSRETTRDPQLVVTTKADLPAPPPSSGVTFVSPGAQSTVSGVVRVEVTAPSEATWVGMDACGSWQEDGSNAGGWAIDFDTQAFCSDAAHSLTVYAYAADGTDLGSSSEDVIVDNSDTPPPPPAQCADGLDNDGDGTIDYPVDPGCASASDNDETNLAQPPPGDVPSPIAGQGYSLRFADDFNTLDRSVWCSHQWYDPVPPSGTQFVDSGILHLQSKRSQGYPWISVSSEPTCGQATPQSFTQGYFEARMKWPAGMGSFPAFWMLSTRHATNSSWPSVNAFCAQNGLLKTLCYSSELDMFEGQGATPGLYYGTVHRNSCSCYGVNDTQNANNATDVGLDLTAGWHVYAALWTDSQIKWYLDGQLVSSAPTYDSTNQPMHLIIGQQMGGWSGDPNASTPDVMDNQVDWVRVWQK